MKKVKAHYYVSTKYVGSERTEDVELEVPDEATENEIDDIIFHDYEEWVWNTIETGWTYENT